MDCAALGAPRKIRAVCTSWQFALGFRPWRAVLNLPKTFLKSGYYALAMACHIRRSFPVMIRPFSPSPSSSALQRHATASRARKICESGNASFALTVDSESGVPLEIYD